MTSAKRQATIESGALAKFAAREKLFGLKASRIERDELPELTLNILEQSASWFDELAAIEQLADKPSFGDMDLIGLNDGDYSQERFQEIFGEDLLDYHANGDTFSLLIRISSLRSIQVDFIRAHDPVDVERKITYFSKGHTSPIIGMLSKALNFKYGTAGFFKRYQDSKGQWHDFLVSENLFEGMQILGLDPTLWQAITKIDDIVNFIASSPMFSSSIFSEESLVRRDRVQLNRIA